MCACMNPPPAQQVATTQDGAPVMSPGASTIPPGDHADGDVLAEVLFAVAMPIGPVSGRSYPVMRLGQVWWVAAVDVATKPMWWRAV